MKDVTPRFSLSVPVAVAPLPVDPQDGPVHISAEEFVEFSGILKDRFFRGVELEGVPCHPADRRGLKTVFLPDRGVGDVEFFRAVVPPDPEVQLPSVVAPVDVVEHVTPAFPVEPGADFSCRGVDQQPVRQPVEQAVVPVEHGGTGCRAQNRRLRVQTDAERGVFRIFPPAEPPGHGDEGAAVAEETDPVGAEAEPDGQCGCRKRSAGVGASPGQRFQFESRFIPV